MLNRRQFIKRCAIALATTMASPLLFQTQTSRASGDIFPILVYHRVGSQPDPLTVSKERFTADLKYLSAAGYETFTVDRLKDHLAGTRPLPDNAVFLTFDDGYANNYTNAFPILQSFEMVASFFVISGMIGQPNRLTAPQIREMSAARMYIGSHTVSHRPLADVAPWEVAPELGRSKADIEDILGKAINFIAYPYGSYDDRILRTAGQTGYWGGLTTNRGYGSLHDNKLALDRIPVFHKSPGMAELLT